VQKKPEAEGEKPPLPIFVFVNTLLNPDFYVTANDFPDILADFCRN
jgi:hypothetical protein